MSLSISEYSKQSMDWVYLGDNADGNGICWRITIRDNRYFIHDADDNLIVGDGKLPSNDSMSLKMTWVAYMARMVFDEFEMFRTNPEPQGEFRFGRIYEGSLESVAMDH
jgi:hypothetical protein